jgi:hypothetical protein
MASANSGLQITNLDFTSIKSSLKTFLQQQDTLKDYNFDASALSVLVDLLAYNTQYNAYYLNMVANEMFLDSAIQRNSVVSHAKLLNYVPKSASAPKAYVNLTVNQVTDAALTIPKYTQFISEAIDGVNYIFVTPESTTVPVTSNTATFTDLEIVQGLSTNISYPVNTTANPKLIFNLIDPNIDTTTLTVSVQESSSNTETFAYTKSTDYISLLPQSKVYFLQEGTSGSYEIYFGDDILGYSPKDGNIVNISYVSTNGTASYGANSFVLLSSVGGYSNTVVTTVSAATKGAERETIDSIKFTAPKAYAAQGRAVTKEDYVYLIQNNNNSIPVDSVSVWGGEENDPPVYGQLFCAVKPSGGFTLTTTQKERLVNEVIKPISVLTVVPTIVDPDYTYLKLDTIVLYDPKKTNYTAGQIQQVVNDAILNFSRNSLNTFNSTFKMPELITSIQSSDLSIVTNETTVKLQKKFYPSLTTKTTYTFDFSTKLKRNYFNAGLSSSPGFSTRDINSNNAVRTGVFFEEVPTVSGGIGSVNILNQGFGYTKVPTVSIVGDGTGATGYAVLAGTRVNSVVITNPGLNYTQAIVTITPAEGDTSGALSYGIPVIEGSIGTLRTYYYQNNTKTILNGEAGTIDYTKGKVTLSDFAPIAIDNDLGQFVITVVPDSTIVSSTYNKIVSLDEFDPDSITLTINAVQ